LVDKYINKLH